MEIRKRVMIGLIVLFLLLTAGVYGYGVFYFSEHFLPGSEVNGFHCSYLTVEETEELLTRKVGAYVLAVQTRRNGQESLTAEQTGLSYQSDGSVKRLIREQKRFLWFLAFQQEKIYEIPSSIQYEEDQTLAAINALKCMQPENITQPSDAHLEETEKGFVIVPEVEGNALKTEETVAKIIQALLTGKTSIDLEESGCYKKPSVYQDDEKLNRNCEQIHQLTDVVITYDFDDRTETVDRAAIQNWLTEDEDGDLILDQTQVADYIRGLAEKYDTVGLDRGFRTYDGREILVEGGTYGWQIDQSAETVALIEQIETGTTQVREPVYLQEGLCRSTNDIGYTYIEIDLTGQRMVFYKDGTPTADAPILSGNPYLPGCATPTGCYRVGEKQTGYVVNGEDYPQAVNYWIPFDQNLGINDAPWRSAFGEQIYEFEGTHGNICAPSDQVQIIFGCAEKNTPVVIYS